VLSVSNDLVSISEELDWKRKTLLNHLYGLDKLVDSIKEDGEPVKEIKEGMKQKISECLSILEDNDSEE